MSLGILPTASGKTIILTTLAEQLEAIVIAPSIELVNQLKQHYPNVYTYNTAYNRKISGKYLLIDEAHRCKSNGMVGAIIERFEIVYGLTATPHRLDIGDIYPGLFKHKVFEVTKEELAQGNYLTKRRYVDISVDKLINVKASVINKIEQLSQEVCPQTKKCIDDFMLQWNGKPTVVFGCDITHCEKIQTCLNTIGFRSQIITGKTRQNVRNGFVKRFKTCKKPRKSFLINCEILTTGFDAPICENILILRPTGSASLYEQICGRGDRLYPGKEWNNIYDYTYSRFNVPTGKQVAGEKFCLHCGELNKSSHQKCTKCGEKLFKYESQTKDCVFCKAKNFIRAKYCIECGKNIAKKYVLSNTLNYFGVIKLKENVYQMLVDNKKYKIVSSGALKDFIDKTKAFKASGNLEASVWSVPPYRVLKEGSKIEKLIWETN